MDIKNLDEKQRLIAVLDMHYSGANAVAHALQILGINSGDKLMASAESSNKDLWEDLELLNLNEEMLNAINSDWHDLAPIKDGDVEQLRNEGYFLRALELLRSKTDKNPILGFNDSRIAKLMPFWKEVFAHGGWGVGYVLAIRNPLSVVKSLAERDGFDAEKSYSLWLGHMLWSLKNTDGKSRVLVDIDRLLLLPENEIKRLAEALNLEIDETELKIHLTEFLDWGSRHIVYTSDDLFVDNTCPPLVREVYLALADAAANSTKLEDAALQGQIERWWVEFERFASTLKLADKLYRQMTIAKHTLSEREGLIASLKQTLAERDGQIARFCHAISERDGQIARFCQAISERDEQISDLNHVVSGRDKQIASLNKTVMERDAYHDETLYHIRNSVSWRLTAPVRIVGTLVKAVTRNLKMASSALFGQMLRLFPARQTSKTMQPIDSKKITSESSENQLIIPRINFDQTSNGFVEYRRNQPIKPLVKIIAFYLPQFHPFPENDQWWGKGFTEWTNVGKAVPNYNGHYQPHCPIHFGYYDLRVPEVMEEQARLAKEYGIYGFSYYFYWFGGKILLDTPLESMLADKNVDMPFCFTWANENWSRRWDGQENDILIAQNHSDADSLAFIRHLVKYFKDERYIRIGGKPVLIIYRANIIPNIAATAKMWRDELTQHGIPGLYLMAAQTFGIRSPNEFDFDASVEFPPHTADSLDIRDELELLNQDFHGHIFSYKQTVANAVINKEPDYKLFRTAMLSWDNTARKQNNGHIFHGFSLLLYKQWLSSIVNKVFYNSKYSSDEKIVFVNAWNEWAEGTHLEPDRKFGYGYLQTTYDVLRDYEALGLANPESMGVPVKQSDYAIILHLHYDDLWPNIREHLIKSFSDSGFDLYVTVTSSVAAQKVRQDFPGAYIELVENRGRDVLPFIRMLRIIKDLGYTAVCKIHSKRSLYRNDGDNIRDEIFDALMRSKEHVEDIVTRFKSNARLGMVAPKKYLIMHNDHNMTFDKEWVQTVADHLQIEFHYDQFTAGSMFWFAPRSLEPLLRLDDSFFEIESGLADGTCAHAVERLFCLIVKEQNYTVESC